MWNESKKEKIDPEKASTMTVEELIKLINIYDALLTDYKLLANNYNLNLRIAEPLLE